MYIIGRNISNTLTSSINDTNSADIYYEQPNSSLEINNNNIQSTSTTSTGTVTSRSTGTVTPQLIMATATLTKAVKALLTDVNGAFNIEFNGKLMLIVLLLKCQLPHIFLWIVTLINH